MPTRIYRNDSDTSYDIPGLGWVHAGQRVSFSGEFPPPLNLVNYPGLVDVLAEEEAGQVRDYEEEPENVVENKPDLPEEPVEETPVEESTNG